MLSAKLTGGQPAVVEGSDTFTPKFTTLLVRQVLSHTRNLPMLVDDIFKRREDESHVGLSLRLLQAAGGRTPCGGN
ncbi:hypothetical protein URH17368_2815 [Alicyclobacillus hesperidum URH17-3-68]|nr:hypothetical protein URH17368_2815 [Alicyclobacillus hesperidum URH17-3-68]